MSRIQRLLVVIAGLTSLGLVASACGADSSSEASSGLKTVRIVAGTPSVFLSDFYIAQEKGYFKDHGLNVKMSYAQIPSAVLVSGDADLAYQTVLKGLESIDKGLPLKAVETVQVNTLPILLSSKKVASIKDLQSMDSCRIGTTAAGNTVYGYASYWIDLLGLKCKLAIAADVPTMVAGVVSGAYDAIVTTPQYGPQTASRGTHVLINPLDVQSDGSASFSKEFLDKYALPEAITTALWGKTSYVKDNEGAMKDLADALDEAQDARQSMSASDVADVMAKANPGAFGPTVIDHKALTDSVTYGITPVGEHQISESLWKSSLASYSHYGVEGYNPDNPAYAYEKVVFDR